MQVCHARPSNNQVSHDNNDDSNNNNNETKMPKPNKSQCNCEPYEHTNWPFFTVACDRNNNLDCCALCNDQPGEFKYVCKDTTAMDQMLYAVPQHYCSASNGRKVMA